MAAALGGEVEVALAARPALTAAAIRDLVGLRREAVDLALANNAGIALRGSTVDTLLERARGNAALAAALLRRADLGPTEAAALYLHAEEARRTQLLASVDGLAGMRKPSLPQPDAAARSALLAHAGAKDGAAFAGELAAMLSLPATPDWRFDDPARHDLLVFALSAAGVPEEEGVRILLTLEPSISLRVDTVLRLVRLSRRLARATAAFMVEAILGVPVGVKPAGQHRPYLDPRGSASRAAAVTALRAARDDLRESRRA
jgi:hypothetical protein